MAKRPSVFTFGYGADHDAEMLRTIADAGGGVYYYMEGGDSVASSFADCLGGLLSVVGQNVRLILSATGGAKIVKLLGTSKTYKAAPTADGGLEISVGDMYSEEEKDLIIEVELPADKSGKAGGACEVLASLSYFDVVNTTIVSKVFAGSGTIPRAKTEAAVVVEVDAQRNRVLAAEAIKSANTMARASGDYAGGRAMLAQTRQTLRASPAADQAMCQKLMADLSSVRSPTRLYNQIVLSQCCPQLTASMSIPIACAEPPGVPNRLGGGRDAGRILLRARWEVRDGEHDAVPLRPEVKHRRGLAVQVLVKAGDAEQVGEPRTGRTVRRGAANVDAGWGDAVPSKDDATAAGHGLSDEGAENGHGRRAVVRRFHAGCGVCLRLRVVHASE